MVGDSCVAGDAGSYNDVGGSREEGLPAIEAKAQVGMMEDSLGK